MSDALSAVLLAAGYGTRLYPLTKDRPKALLPLGDTVLLDPVMDALRAVPGLASMVLVSNHRFAEGFRQWRAQRGLALEVVDDGTDAPETRLGAIRDLLLGLARVPASHDALVLGTDNLFTWSLAEFVRVARTKRPAATVTLRQSPSRDEARRCAVVDVEPDGRVRRYVEKPAEPFSSIVGLCVYYLPSSVRRRVQEFLDQGGQGDAPGYFIEWLVSREPVYGFLTAGEWFDVGTQASYQAAVQRWPGAERGQTPSGNPSFLRGLTPRDS
ncbi:MAG: nucleotidyltransferase family protein [Candidatus Omnitrophica bacterium]|nr:nucleotidyltransferase family protein [Candidatus Omnitrophota bacterium]